MVHGSVAETEHGGPVEPGAAMEREPAVSPSPVQGTVPCSALAIPVQASAPSPLAVPH